MSSEPSAEEPGLLVRMAPSWDQIDPLRQYVNAWIAAKGSRESADRAGLVVQELLENAVKYGDPKADIEIAIFVSRSGHAIDIRVKNSAHPSRLAILEREIVRNRASDPREAFARALERLNRLPEGSSMLGLARVALESNLDVQIGSGFVVTTARISSGSKPSAGAPRRISSGSMPRYEVPPNHASGTRVLDPVGDLGMADARARAGRSKS